MRNLFVGAISLWFGSLASIPKGYALCNGENGTPDLQNRFIVGAGDTYPVDDVGGNINHSHTFQGDNHQHATKPGGGIQSGSGFDRFTTLNFERGTTDNTNGLPPYHSLAYIMEL